MNDTEEPEDVGSHWESIAEKNRCEYMGWVVIDHKLSWSYSAFQTFQLKYRTSSGRR